MTAINNRHEECKVLPSVFQHWFEQRGWQLRDYQQQVLAATAKHNNVLVTAATGAGKTLAGFLPSLIDLHQHPVNGLHTLYLSPLKALTQDVHRNVLNPIAEMNLAISAETRTGDTPSHKRQRQRKKPPNILLTTPESCMLMLSYADAGQLFGQLKWIIVDEVHSLMANKRGDFTSLCLARLRYLCPTLKVIALSATVADPIYIRRWLAPDFALAHHVDMAEFTEPKIQLLHTEERIPFGGFMASYAINAIYQQVTAAVTTLVFVNTRAQAELVFQMLWQENAQGLPIALYHGSLEREQRRKIEVMMADGMLRAIVCTSALELGIDWGDVDQVIQVGAPKGVSRLLQRIGRANHRLDSPSVAFLVPANRFEVLECQAAIDAIHARELDGDTPTAGALDIIPQYIINCACSEAISAQDIYHQVTTAYPYRDLSWDTFYKLWQFSIDGGNALNAYERYQRLIADDDGYYIPANRRVMLRHRQNIGTIVEAGKLKVKRIRRGNQSKIVGEVEEYFAQQLVAGDTFLFAGEVLVFEGIRDMQVHACPGKGKEPKIPSYVGGQMPLSTFLAERVRNILSDHKSWCSLPSQVLEWLELQQAFSVIPQAETLLIEQFPRHQSYITMYYTFDGRKANQTLGMLLTKRMEKLGLKPLSFSVTDYGLSITSLSKVASEMINELFNPDILGDELENWMLQAPMLKRAFRQVAVVSGVTEQNYHSSHKSLKQVTFSTDLIYDTLREHDPDHILLTVTREDAERELLDLQRLANLLIRYYQRVQLVDLPKVSPLAIPIVLNVRSEQVKGAGAHALLEQAALYDEAENMLAEVRALLSTVPAASIPS